jgi:hypothetical protein
MGAGVKIWGSQTPLEGTGWLPIKVDANGILQVETSYSGTVYAKSDTATADSARRFETSAKKLRDVIITVKTYAQLFGGLAGQTYPVAADETFSITQIDISTLYFKNATAGQNGTVHILAVND